MASYRQLPRRLPAPAPALPHAVAGAGPLRGGDPDPHAPAGADGLPRDDVLVRRDALVHDRARVARRPPLPLAATRRSCTAHGRTSAPAGVDWPLFAILGGLGTLIAWLVIVVQEPITRWAGFGWLVFGFVAYAIYRRRFVHEPSWRRRCAPRSSCSAPGSRSSTARSLVPVSRSAESEEALVAAARLAAERGATIAVVRVLEVPLELPLDAELPDEEDEADMLLDEARALVESYGVRAVPRLVRARRAGPAIVEEAAGRRRRARRRRAPPAGARGAAARSSARRSTRSCKREPVAACSSTAGRRAAAWMDSRGPGYGRALGGRGSCSASCSSFETGDRRRVARLPARRPLPRRRSAAAGPRPEEPLMARKLPGLDARARADARSRRSPTREIGSSVYFALGIVALYAAGLTPWVLLGVGLVILLVTLSYAEASSALPETGGAALFVARAFNDPVGFLTGWVLFLDYLIVIALAGLFVPHYVGAALGWERHHEGAWDGIVGVCVILGVAGVPARPARRALPHRRRSSPRWRSSPISLLVVLGLALRLLADRDLDGRRPGHGAGVGRPRLRARARDARLHRPRDGGELRRRGARARDARCRAASSSASALVVLVTAAIGPRLGVSGPRACRQRARRRRSSRSSTPSRAQLPGSAVDALRVFVGLGARRRPRRRDHHGDLRRRAARLRARAPRACCPHAFARLSRRTLLAPAAILERRPVLAAALLARRRRRRARRALPREPLQLRHPPGPDRGAAGGGAAALHRAGPRAAVPGAVERGRPRRAGPGARARRRACSPSRSGSSPSRRTSAARIVGPALGRARRRRLRRRAPGRRGSPSWARRAGRPGPRPARCAAEYRAHPRSAQARADRRGGARDRAQAGGGDATARSASCTSSGCRSTRRSTRRCPRRRRAPRPRSPRRRSSRGEHGVELDGPSRPRPRARRGDRRGGRRSKAPT